MGNRDWQSRAPGKPSAACGVGLRGVQGAHRTRREGGRGGHGWGSLWTRLGADFGPKIDPRPAREKSTCQLPHLVQGATGRPPLSRAKGDLSRGARKGGGESNRPRGTRAALEINALSKNRRFARLPKNSKIRRFARRRSL